MEQSVTIPSVNIVIVNWNAGTQLRECLTSLVNTDTSGVTVRNVVVVDNASSDDSLQGIEELRLPLTLIRNSDNRGFAAACNQGAATGTADYLLFLNPDTILYPDSLTTPLLFMERPENAQVGIIGIQLTDEDGAVSRTCSRFPTAGMFFSKMFGLDRLFPAIFPSHSMAEWDHGTSRDVDQIMGAYFLVRTPLFLDLDGFDESFFVYFEEVDFSLRAVKKGWRSFYLTDARAFHRGGGTSEQVKAARLFYSLRSRILYGCKHFTKLAAISLLLATLTLEPASRIALLLARRSLKEVTETITAYVRLWRSLPLLIKSTALRSRQ